MTTEDRPAIVLHNLRGIARDAIRLGQKLDPQLVLNMIAGKRA